MSNSPSTIIMSDRTGAGVGAGAGGPVSLTSGYSGAAE